jgi:cell shape-determining protein MreD
MVYNLVIIMAAVLGIYAILMSRIAHQVAPTQQRLQLARFTLGLLAVLIVFIPSPDIFGPDYRFTVSMGQLLFAVDLAPLLLYS